MTREELKVHCEKQVEMCEIWAIGRGEKPSGKIYEEHKLILELLEQEPKTSHWIDDKCSVCGKGTEDLIDSREWYRNEAPNFCPFCGLKLVKPQESEK